MEFSDRGNRQHMVGVLRAIAWLVQHNVAAAGITWRQDMNAPPGRYHLVIELDSGELWRAFGELEQRHGKPRV